MAGELSSYFTRSPAGEVSGGDGGFGRVAGECLRKTESISCAKFCGMAYAVKALTVPNFVACRML
jgi:hypothetical protein